MISVHAQVEYPPDYLDASPKMFYENKGQIIDDMNNVRNDVKYYTTALSPNVYLFDDAKMSFVQVHGGNDTIPDTLSRVDFQLVGEAFQRAEVNASNKSTDYRNYYLPHCSNGATFCHAYEQFNYREVYPNIDFEVRANQQWGKYYFIVHPGGNPNDIEFEFTGQDSANIDPYWLELYYHTDILELPNAIAYELNSNGSMSPVNWSPAFLNLGNGKIGFQTGGYNANKVLVIQLAPPMGPNGPTGGNDNLEWSTFYGGTLDDSFNDVVTDGNDNVYLTGATYSSNFPAQNGTTISVNGLLSDIITVKFNNIAELQWASIIGGGSDLSEKGNVVKITNSNKVIVGGRASQSFPTNQSTTIGSAYFDPTPSGGGSSHSSGFVVQYNNNGIEEFATFLGNLNDSRTQVHDIAIGVDNKIYVVGMGYISNAPGGTNSSSTGGGFVFELDNDFVPIWSTQYGSQLEASVNSIALFYNDVGNEIYITGQTYQGITQTKQIAPNNAYQHPNTNGGGDFDAFITHFKLDRSTDWATYYGGNDEEQGNKIYLKNGILTVCGYTKSNNFSTYQGTSTYPNSSFGGVTDAFFLQFHRVNGQRIWATYYGGNDEDVATDIVDVDGILYFVGFTGSNNLYTNQWVGYNFYWNANFNANNPQLPFYDGFLVGFDNNLSPKIGTYFGNKYDDQILGITKSTNNDIYIVGKVGHGTHSINPSPNTFPLQDFNSNSSSDYYVNTNYYFDGFISRFSLPMIVDSKEIIAEKILDLGIFPNPSDGIFNLDLSNFNLNDKGIVEIYHSNGQILKTINNPKSQTIINLSNYTKGLYYIRVIIDDKVFVKSVLIQ